jgi:hypothetical protein
MTTEVLGSTTAKPEPPASWIPDDSTFGARLALIRQRMAWGNVKEAALACDVPPESWRTWERDGVEPRGLTRIARKISEATGCDYGWLVDGPALAGRVIAQVPTVRYADLTERPGTRHPADNRPSTRKPVGRPDPHRTSRVPRQGRH